MKLCKKIEKLVQWGEATYVQAEEPATLDDLRAALAEHGMVAVPVEPTEAMCETGKKWLRQAGYMPHAIDVKYVYKAMIKAAEGRDNG